MRLESLIYFLKLYGADKDWVKIKDLDAHPSYITLAFCKYPNLLAGQTATMIETRNPMHFALDHNGRAISKIRLRPDWKKEYEKMRLQRVRFGNITI